MATLKSKFEQAVADSKELPKRPDNQTLLKIYALYKQATVGDATGKRAKLAGPEDEVIGIDISA
jgi:diazepam-binding inhibitor (GABA receptor modulating acyl-CoA-binding protein)